MRTAKVADQHLFRLEPDSPVEALLLGQWVAAEVEKAADRIRFVPDSAELVGIWDCAGRADEDGYVGASIIVRRARREDELDILGGLFQWHPTKTVEMERLPVKLAVTVSDPDEPRNLRVICEVPGGRWHPFVTPSMTELDYGLALYVPADGLDPQPSEA